MGQTLGPVISVNEVTGVGVLLKVEELSKGSFLFAFFATVE